MDVLRSEAYLRAFTKAAHGDQLTAADETAIAAARRAVGGSDAGLPVPVQFDPTVTLTADGLDEIRETARGWVAR